MGAFDSPLLANLDRPLWTYDAYIERWVWRGEFKRAFSAAFQAPERNVCFRISDWVNSYAPIVMAYRFARVHYSLQLSFRLTETYPFLVRLQPMLQRLKSAIVFDVETSSIGPLCLKLTPEGQILNGRLIEYGRERLDGSRPMKFIH